MIIHESINGLNSSINITISERRNEFISRLDELFKSDTNKGIIRKSNPAPTETTPVSEIEEWQFNEQLTKLSWENLSLENAAVMLANYIFLTVGEKLAFQPILWRFLLNSNIWNSHYSSVLLSFILDADSAIPTLKDMCSEKQKEILTECFNFLLDDFSNKKIEVEDGLSVKDEIELVSNVIAWWNK